MSRKGVNSGTINLLNTILGSGILSMPYGIKSNGICFGTFLIIVSALASAFGLYLQNEMTRFSNNKNFSYFTFSQMTYPNFTFLSEFAIFIKCFGVIVSYLIVIGDLMPKIVENVGFMKNDFFLNKNFWISFFMSGIIIPLSFLRKIDSLKYTSTISLFSIFYLQILIIYHYFFKNVTSVQPDLEMFGPRSLKSTFSSLSLFVFSFTCHQNMFPILNELNYCENQGSKNKQTNLIIRNSILISSSVYLIVGIFGYLTFGDQVNGNIISMYENSSVLTLIGRFCIVIMVSLSYPLQFHPCRNSINNVYCHLNLKSNLAENYQKKTNYLSFGSDSNFLNLDQSKIEEKKNNQIEIIPSDNYKTRCFLKQRYKVITSLILFLSFIFSLFISNLEIVLLFVGATGSTSISFFLPGLFSYMMIKSKIIDDTKKKIFLLKYGSLLLIMWGIIITITCLIVIIFLDSKNVDF